MALTSSINYVTTRNLKDIYPGLDSYDSKVLLYGFTLQESGEGYASAPYLSPNSGLVTNLYRDGHSLTSGKQTIGASVATLVNEADVTAVETEITLDDRTKIHQESYIKIDDEIMYVKDTSGDASIVVARGRLGTATATHNDNAEVYQHFFPSADGQWLYDSDNDFLIMSASSNPSDNSMESGEDVDTLITRVMKRASRMFESELDSRLSREVKKDREGNYPEYVIRAVGLKSIVMLMQSKDPENPVIDSFNEEYREIIEGYRSGNIQMPTAVTADAAKGVIRDIQVAGNIRPVDTRGQYAGTYDVLKVKITKAGIFGVSTYSVWAKGNDKLGIQEGVEVVTGEIITGDYQPLAYGMQIRFGSPAKSSASILNDEWEIELKGNKLPTSTSHVSSIRLTRR